MKTENEVVKDLDDLAKHVKSGKRLYTLEYKVGSSRCEKMFWFEGIKREAELRARLHCQRMNFTFIHVFPAIVDLEHQEMLKSRNPDFKGEE